MTERMITADCIDAVAIAEAPAKHEQPETVSVCVSDGSESHPVALPKDAGADYIKKATGAECVQELQYDVAGRVFREAGSLKPFHSYEIFPADRKKLESFLAEHGLHR